MEDKFSEHDKEKLIEFLNLVAKHADFSDIKLTDIIKIYGALSHVQKEVIPKIQANIMEITKVVEADSIPDIPQDGDK